MAAGIPARRLASIPNTVFGRSPSLPVAGGAAAASSARNYASPASSASPLDFAVSEAGGYKIASQNDASGTNPTSAIAVVLKAGPRYEPEPGLSHALKNFVFRATNKRSALRLIRETEIYGGVLGTSLSREHVLLTAEFLKGDEQYFAEILGDALSEAKLALYEYKEDVIPQLQTEYSQALETPQVYAMDIAHSLAFRSGLGNSLFASPHVEVAYDKAAAYAQSAFASAANTAIVAANVESATLKSLVSDYFSSSSAGGASGVAPVSGNSSTYFGGEARFPSSGHSHGHNDGHLLVAFKGASQDKSAAVQVLQHLLGGGEASVKWCQGATGFNKAAPGAKAFSVSYSDAGLVGFTIDAPTSRVGDIASKAVAEMKRVAKGGLQNEEVKAAIAKAKFAAANVNDHRLSKLELAGSSVMAYGSVPSLSSSFSALDKVTGDEIAKTAAAALKTTPTFVAIGNTHRLPYSSDLGL